MITDHRLLRAQELTAGYAGRPVLTGLDLSIVRGRITALIGPNACGKSTLLSTLTRLLAPTSGSVLLDGKDIHSLPTRAVARELGILPQSPAAPDGITVAELVRRGRYPHRRFGAGTADDDAIVAAALHRTGVGDLAIRDVDTLSGGQRQRVWVAMVLAQQTPILLLDEPTSYLDVAHQVEVLDLLVDLRQDGKTIIVVLHDLNQAAHYADTVVALRDGQIIAAGPPAQVITQQLVEHVFGLQNRVITDPDTGSPLVLARGRHQHGTARPTTPHHSPV